MVGGLLVDGVSWRAAFLVNVPLVVVALWATRRHMAETKAEGATGRFDWLGALVVAMAVGGIAFGAIRGQDRQWQDPLAWGSLAVGSWRWSCSRCSCAAPPPARPAWAVPRRRFATINLSTLLIYGALYTVFTFQGLFLQTRSATRRRPQASLGCRPGSC